MMPLNLARFLIIRFTV